MTDQSKKKEIKKNRPLKRVECEFLSLENPKNPIFYTKSPKKAYILALKT